MEPENYSGPQQKRREQGLCAIMDYLKAFTTLLSNFLADLSLVFPHEAELKAYRSSTGTMIRLKKS
jgi:hypothetical protein